MKSNLRFCNEYSIRLIGLLMCIHSGSTISPFTIPARFLQSLDRLLLCSIEFFFKSIIMFWSGCSVSTECPGCHVRNLDILHNILAGTWCLHLQVFPLISALCIEVTRDCPWFKAANQPDNQVGMSFGEFTSMMQICILTEREKNYDSSFRYNQYENYREQSLGLIDRFPRRLCMPEWWLLFIVLFLEIESCD